MRLPLQSPFRFILSSSNIRMSSNHLLKSTLFPPLFPTTLSQPAFHSRTVLVLHIPSSLVDIHPYPSLRVCASTYTSLAEITSPAHLERPQSSELHENKMKELGRNIGDCTPGQHKLLLCPMCKGGDSSDKSLYLVIEPSGKSAAWNCHKEDCGWKGSVPTSHLGNSSCRKLDQEDRLRSTREVVAEKLKLESLCPALIAYFAERKISEETLRKNFVMQKQSKDKTAFIAFPYLRDGKLVSCKYRDANKKFWQEKNTEKILYGLDGIKEADVIIIVEGEIDKLAMEEAGFPNCVSVPDGAPASVSSKELPPVELDTKYRYLYNCKSYLDKASRIILATDGDKPGQALAVELSRRLGREKCWLVRWPKKNEVDKCKDANEVLMDLGPDALRKVIENAEFSPSILTPPIRKASSRKIKQIDNPTGTCNPELDANNNFCHEKNPEKKVYGFYGVKDTDDIILVEGEMDKLAMEEAGFLKCVTIPDCSPPSVYAKELPPNGQEFNFKHLEDCLGKASRIILATAGDKPGQASAEEISRRLGKEKCWRVRWPKKKELDDYCKDANEVLKQLGPNALRDAIDKAEFFPIKGLLRFSEFDEEITAYYNQSGGDELGLSTGWKSLNELYKVVPGELTIVSGVPNSGKSEWIDALICNLNRSNGWKFALCSMENRVREHARKLLEKRIKKPFFEGRYGHHSGERISIVELEEGKKWLADTFYLVRCENDSLPSIEWVLEKAKAAVLRYGIRGLVIDPYNELDHQRRGKQTETEYVSQMLTLVKRFAQYHSCHVWFVAHPRQLHDWNGSPPNLYDISGSAHFINKCDNGIIIHRIRDADAKGGRLSSDQVQVCVRKVRNKVAGTIGDAFLSYNKVTGEYTDAPKENGKNES